MGSSRTASQALGMEASGGKRRRISLACSACRARKSRCDGARPKCSACDELSFECVYVQSASSSNIIVGKEYLTSIEERLKTAEENISALQAGQAPPPRQLRFEDESGTGAIDSVSTNGPSIIQDSVVLDANCDEVQHLVTLEDENDGMGGVIFSVEEDCGFFGPSSNIAFNRHISRAVAQLSRVNQYWSNTSDNESQRLQSDIGIMSASRPSSPLGHRATHHRNGSRGGDTVDLYALPAETRTRELISRYFGDTGLLFPYIHEGSFWDSYNEMRNSHFTRVRRSWLGLLNIVMALATSTTFDTRLSAERRTCESDVYYQRAVGLCEKQIMRGTSLEIVQFLLVMGQYLQGTQRSIETWTIHGLAVKAALQLGLHSVKASESFSPMIREFRKRTWFGCVVLDRTLSMTFGRPAAIPDEYVIIDLPCHINTRNSSESSELIDPQKEISLNFFNATITLYKIMWKIINASYGGNIGSEGQPSVVDNISGILQMEQQLVEWERRLPPDLALRRSAEVPPSPETTDSGSSFEKFRIILTLRHHNLRILLHRPILVSFLDLAGNGSPQSDPQSASLLQQIGTNSVQICVQSSMEIISLISTIVSSTGERRTWLGAWWFSLYYTFNAALVLFGSFLIVQNRPNIGSAGLSLSLSPAEMQMSLIDAAISLRRLDTENRMIDRCAVYIDKLVGVFKHLSMQAATQFSMTPLMPNSSSIESTSNPQPLFTAEDYQSNNDIFQNFPNTITSNPSPLGMDLGEFMLEGDIDFLDQLMNMGAAMGMNKDFEFNPLPMTTEVARAEMGTTYDRIEGTVGA